MARKARRPLAGRVVLVTGASAGVGEAAARAFARAGAAVVLAARRAERLERLAGEIEAAGGEALPVPTDVTEPAQVSRLVQRALERFGRIDVLANIAGWGKYEWIDEIESQALRQQYAVNVLGMAELTRQVVPVMQRQRRGHILNMSSYASRIAIPPMTIYASTKYAVEGLSDGLRRELAPWGIRVSRIHPSGVAGTEFNKRSERRGGVRFGLGPVGRLSKEGVAQALVKLVQRPRRELLLGRVYDVGVFANRHLPGLVDALSAFYVRRKRRRALAAPPERREQQVARPRSSAAWLPALLMAAAVLAALVGLARAPLRPRSGR